jgi:hypothetical protein
MLLHRCTILPRNARLVECIIYKCELKHLQHEGSDVEPYTYMYIYIYIYINTRMTFLLEAWRHLSSEIMRHLSFINIAAIV